MSKYIFLLVAYYLRSSSIELGRYRLLKIFRPLSRELGRKIGKSTITTKIGFKMDLDLSDHIPQDIYLTGVFEETTSNILMSLLKPGHVAVDVGANIGWFSLLFRGASVTLGKCLHSSQCLPLPQN
ncbi:hypothetical protein sS8_1864 [Methylocaldum marinum]|uniref:FkbM family methyltransferase n=2 Tax=Methylocaldum marinum TaxID=1432792 RepID=A0A250KQD0_9GAMM|nr:hypothetical protein sS8_1864 [Methylocaldum marinum]